MDHPLDDINSPPALKTLRELYEQRADLQEVFPEVREGDMRRLIDWAAGVTAQKWKDRSYSVLKPHTEWYSNNFTGTPARVSAPLWETIEQTSKRSDNQMPVTLSIMRDELARDISHHLTTLSMLVTEFNLKHIVELGTRNGWSTLALLEAAQKVGGHVLSIDIEPCLEAKKRVQEAGFSKFWKFLQANDLEVKMEEIPKSIDLLFIDTNHIYNQTIAELRKYGQFLGKGSWIALHDYISYPGVSRAVHEFVESLSHEIRIYPFLHQNGLALIKI